MSEKTLEEMSEQLAKHLRVLPGCMDPEHRGPYEGCVDCSVPAILAFGRAVAEKIQAERDQARKCQEPSR